MAKQKLSPKSTSTLSIPSWSAVITLLLTVLAMTIGTVVWATSSHAEIKDWTSNQDFVTKSVVKEQYVPRYEFAKVEQSLKDHKIAHDKIESQLDKVLEKLHEVRVDSRPR